MFVSAKIKNNGTIKGFTKRLNRYFLAHKDRNGNFFEIKNNILYLRNNPKSFDIVDTREESHEEISHKRTRKWHIKSSKYKEIISNSFIMVNSITPIFPLDSKENWLKLEFITPPNYTRRKSIKWRRQTSLSSKPSPSQELLKLIKDSKIEVRNEKAFLRAAKLFFRFVEEKCPHKALGWKHSEYIGKTKESYCLNDVNIIDVNAIPGKGVDPKAAYIETLKMLEIADHNVTYTLFAYVLLSFANRLIKDYRKQGYHYFINVYGKNPHLTYKSICKFFADFSADTTYNNHLSNKHRIDFQAININKLYELFTLVSDYPIIIESAKSISISSGKFNKILEFIQNRRLNEFLIFATAKPIDSDNIFTLNLSGPNNNGEAVLNVSKNLNKYHCIIDKFVLFIKNNYVGYPIKDPKLSKTNEYYEEIVEKTAPPDDRASSHWLPFAINLNYAFHLFIEFGLENGWIDEATAMSHTDTATNIFKDIIATEKVLPTSIELEEVVPLFKDYVNDIFNSNNRHIPSYCHWDAKGNRHDTTPCYYLEHKLYFQDFCNQKDLTNIDKDAFEKHLYQIHWIKRRESEVNGTHPIGLDRKIPETATNIPKGKASLNVLVIKKEYIQ